MSAIASLNLEASLRGTPANPLAHSLLETMVLSLPRTAGEAHIRPLQLGRGDRGLVWASDSRLIITGPGSNVGPDTLVRTQLETSLTLAERHDHQGGLVHYDVVVGGGSSSITLRNGGSDLASTSGHDVVDGRPADALAAPGIRDAVPGGVKFDIVLSHDDNLAFSAGYGDRVQPGADRHTVYGDAGNGLGPIADRDHRTIFAERLRLTGFDRDGANPAVYSASGGQFIQGAAGRLRVDVAVSPNDTIFGGSAHDHVRLAQSARDVDRALTTHNPDGSTTIHFLNEQTLSLNDGRLSFDDHKHHPGSASPFNKNS